MHDVAGKQADASGTPIPPDPHVRFRYLRSYRAMEPGIVFTVDCDDGTTGLVLVGRGELRLSPAPATEKGQLRLFAGSVKTRSAVVPSGNG